MSPELISRKMQEDNVEGALWGTVIVEGTGMFFQEEGVSKGAFKSRVRDTNYSKEAERKPEDSVEGLRA